MLKSILLTYYVQYTLVECAIYDYKVLKLNPSLIERQRQDTRDMCRIFNEDNHFMEQDSIYHGLETNQTHHNTEKRRFKRGLEDGSKLTLEEARKVESVVDKMYDELVENGSKVTYRKIAIDTKPPPSPSTLSGRRFDFAPKLLIGLLKDTAQKELAAQEGGQYPFQPWPKKWPLGIVPYYIDTKTYDNELLESIRRALDYFEKATCIRLQKLRVKPDDAASLEKVEWIYITNPMGVRQCVHSNENKKNKGVQMVVLGYDCLSLGEILHEVMHVLGFPHEHTRPDRNDYISVQWENIKPGYKKYFEIRGQDVLMKFPYDYSSVTHYPARAFSRNGQPTIKTLEGQKIGQREGLSEVDIMKVTIVYGSECVLRNQQYLQLTCPNIIHKNHTQSVNITEEEIKKYFAKRLWPYGIVNYRIRDVIEFSIEERENIKSVIRHIEKETCLVFRDFTDTPEITGEDLENNGTVPQIGTELPGQDSDFEVAKNANNVVNDISSDDNKIPQQLSAEAVDENKRGDDVEEARSSKKRIRRAAPAPTRRHASPKLTFVRGTTNGCKCPKSGDLQDILIVPINGDCFNSANDLLHLFVHLLGLDHEHDMYDRDDFLTILWDKLPPDMKADLQDKKPPPASVGFEYDYQSVMHWPWLHVEGGKTNIIYPNWNDGWTMGHWQGLSATDVKKLNHIYADQCEGRKSLGDKYNAGT